MNTFTLGACFQHKLHTGPYFMTFAPRLVGVRVIFSLFVNMENKLSSLGTKQTSWIRNDSTDWVQNDLVGYEMTTYKGSLLSKRSYYMQPCILNGQILDIIFSLYLRCFAAIA